MQRKAAIDNLREYNMQAYRAGMAHDRDGCAAPAKPTPDLNEPASYRNGGHAGSKCSKWARQPSAALGDPEDARMHCTKQGQRRRDRSAPAMRQLTCIAPTCRLAGRQQSDSEAEAPMWQEGRGIENKTAHMTKPTADSPQTQPTFIAHDRKPSTTTVAQHHKSEPRTCIASVNPVGTLCTDSG